MYIIYASVSTFVHFYIYKSKLVKPSNQFILDVQLSQLKAESK